MDELKHWVAFHRVSGLGPTRFGKLENYFGSMKDAWNSDESEMILAGLDTRTAREASLAKESIDPDGEMERLEQAGVEAIHLRSDNYPHRLREIYDPPSVIYVRGEIAPEDERGVAVVGTRGPTAYGREMARRLSADLAAAGVSVFSGLARGIDGIAHTAALDAGGRTLAVMGGGLDRIYPREHKFLASRIVDQGAVISEYPLGSRPQAQHFPRRNRIISGLALGVLVVEAGMKSGALLTVRWALDQDREVFAVPGPVISEKSAGTNWLIQQGAKLVADCQDVLEELNIAGIDGQLNMEGVAAVKAASDRAEAVPAAEIPSNGHGISDNNEIEDRILATLGELGGQAHVDDLIRAAGLSPGEVTAGLTVLELKQMVSDAGGMQFVLAPAGSKKRMRKRQEIV